MRASSWVSLIALALSAQHVPAAEPVRARDLGVPFDGSAGPQAGQAGPNVSVTVLANENISPLFDATVLATEEAIVNAMIAAQDMRGDRGHVVNAIDHEELRRLLREYNRLDRRGGADD